MVVLTVVINAAGESVAPKFGKYYVEKKSIEFRNLLLKLLWFGALLGVGGIVIVIAIGKPLLSCVYINLNM